MWSKTTKNTTVLQISTFSSCATTASPAPADMNMSIKVLFCFSDFYRDSPSSPWRGGSLSVGCSSAWRGDILAHTHKYLNVRSLFTFPLSECLCALLLPSDGGASEISTEHVQKMFTLLLCLLPGSYTIDKQRGPSMQRHIWVSRMCTKAFHAHTHTYTRKMNRHTLHAGCLLVVVCSGSSNEGLVCLVSTAERIKLNCCEGMAV